jgi:hypothetical protein
MKCLQSVLYNRSNRHKLGKGRHFHIRILTLVIPGKITSLDALLIVLVITKPTLFVLLLLLYLVLVRLVVIAVARGV